MCNASNEKPSAVLDKNLNNIVEMARNHKQYYRLLKKQGVEGGGGWERPMDEKVDVEKLESGEPPSSSHIYNSSNINVNID